MTDPVRRQASNRKTAPKPHKEGHPEKNYRPTQGFRVKL